MNLLFLLPRKPTRKHAVAFVILKQMRLTGYEAILQDKVIEAPISF